MAAIEKLDGAIGKLLDALNELELRDSTLLIFTADHGGAGRTHGPEDPRSRTIPWIVSGPGIRKDFDLTRLGGDFNIDTYDTFATACTMLGIPVKRRIVGKFMPQILNQQELTLPGKPPAMAPATAPAEGT
jgi:arylsulfatase A-like enzyme